ncbi:MAG: bifunctional aspartate kinase/homoserine dehydrogenase I [Bdellovibrionales bacterium]|nr:bifunctional aspartate kinase/homoserine dehydrogenase I [Bdellovibrionales bacterium]
MWTVHKFGGTSLRDAGRIRVAAELALADHRARGAGVRTAVVVSALGGVTDALIAALEKARLKDAGAEAALDAVILRQTEAARGLFGSSAPEAGALEKDFARDRADLSGVLGAVALARAYPPQTLELFSGYGELWSARLMAAWLAREARSEDGGVAPWVDAREVLIVEPAGLSPLVRWDLSQVRIEKWLKSQTQRLCVITGYVASTPEGVPVTLQRNGSDYSAAIFGRLLKAREVVIWTDVDGVLSADPRRVPDAVVLPSMSYAEAAELAYFGAKVLHPSTMAPAAELGIPILIKNTLNPSAPGTRIGPVSDASPGRGSVKGFSTVDRVALVSVEGTGMMGVPGVAERVFGALREAKISVILISQASSEHSICFAVPGTDSARARETVERAFFAEIQHGQVERVNVIENCSVVAAVGDAMVERPGVAGQFLSALARAGVSVRAIAQGSSERNISVVVDGAQADRALRAAHSAFFLSSLTLSVAVIGPGGIGGELLRQIEMQAEALKKRFDLDLRLLAVASSQRVALEPRGIAWDAWRSAWDSAGPGGLTKLAGTLRAGAAPHAVIVDCSASPDVAARYAGWMKQGIHIVTPNKQLGSGEYAAYRAVKEIEEKGGARFFAEATVGAGLPVLSTLRELLRTGDEILEIQGVLSGTLSFLFGAFGPGKPFSGAVIEAKARGYTEPDPRDDLSGRDVARKLVILAREAGAALDLAGVKVESLVPKSLESLPDPDSFMKRLPEADAAMEARAAEAASTGDVLRYVGTLKFSGPGRATARVGVERVPSSHPLAGVQGGDNLILFRTRRYDQRPLVVRGPGAGREVTAGGVFGDLLKLAAYLGAPV